MKSEDVWQLLESARKEREKVIVSAGMHPATLDAIRAEKELSGGLLYPSRDICRGNYPAATLFGVKIFTDSELPPNVFVFKNADGREVSRGILTKPPEPAALPKDAAKE